MIYLFNPESLRDYTVARNAVYDEYQYLFRVVASGDRAAYIIQEADFMLQDAFENDYMMKLNSHDYGVTEDNGWIAYVKDVEHAMPKIKDYVNFINRYHDVKDPDNWNKDWILSVPYRELHGSHTLIGGYAHLSYVRSGIEVLRYSDFYEWADNLEISPFDRTSYIQPEDFIDDLKEQEILIHQQRESSEEVEDKTTVVIDYEITGQTTPEERTEFETAYKNKINQFVTDFCNNYNLEPEGFVPLSPLPEQIKFNLPSQTMQEEYAATFITEFENEFYNWFIYNWSDFKMAVNYLETTVQRDVSVGIVNGFDNFNTLYDEYCNSLIVSRFNNDGNMILSPSGCDLNANINETWTLTLTHPFDEQGKYSYIKEGSVIAAPAKVAREQTNDIQFFRIFTVEYDLNGVTATAYPIAMESSFDAPILGVILQKVTASDAARYLSEVYREKYTVLTNIPDTKKRSMYGQATNVQEMLAGDQEASFINLFGGEIIYDNYHYIVNSKVGDNTKNGIASRRMSYGLNITGLRMTEDTWDTITRIYPISSEGYSILQPYEQINPSKAIRNKDSRTPKAFVDSQFIDDHPFPHAKVIQFSDVTLLDTDELEEGQKESKTHKVTRAARAAITSKVREMTKAYIKKARAGEWNYSKIVTTPDAIRTDAREPDYEYHQKDDRVQLPYGYILYSFKDAINYLKTKVLGDMISLDAEEQALYEEAIEAGFNWCTKTNIAKWEVHDTSNGRYYGTLANKEGIIDQVKFCWWYVGGKWRWFDKDGYTNKDLEEWQTYKWVERVGTTTVTTYSDKLTIAESKKAGTDETNATEQDPDPNPLIHTWYSVDGTCKKTVTPGEKIRQYAKDGETVKVTYDGTLPSIPPYLQNGSSGYNVTYLQQFLVWYGQNIDIDGVFGDDTENALKSFQSSQGLENDGIFGPDTLEAAKKYEKDDTIPSDILRNMWIEENSKSHYYVDENGNRTIEDTMEWAWTGDETNGYFYKRVNNGFNENNCPIEGQFMYIQERKTWYKFGADGRVIGPYLSDAEWSFHKDSSGWWFGTDQGSMIKGQWVKINSHWYYVKTDGRLDKTTDDFNANKKSEFVKKDTPEVDYNREGVDSSVSGSSSTDKNLEDNTGLNNNSRDGVRAWIQPEVIAAVKKVITDGDDKGCHYTLWNTMIERLVTNARKYLKTEKYASITIDVDLKDLTKTQGFEQYDFLKEMYLGDGIHFVDNIHGFDFESRLKGMTFDCINQEIKDMTFGYPRIKKSFINTMASLHPTGVLNEYEPNEFLQDGYGGYLSNQPYGTSREVADTYGVTALPDFSALEV